MNARWTNAAPWFLIGLVLFPLVPGADGLLGAAGQAAIFTIVAASLVLLTGWVGQISLGHAALVGIGAYATGFASARLGLPFPLSLPVAVAAGAGVAALLGVVALRVRGLYLAVATLIFSWAASEYLFRQQWLLDHSSIPLQVIGAEGSALRLDLSSRFVNYYIAWAVAVALLFALVNLRDSKTGRAFFAVRGSEMAAASLGMEVLRYKSLAFGLSGALAGIAGNLLMTHALVVSPDSFDFTRSLFYLAIAVVGGVTSLPGAVAAAVVFAAMGEVFFRVAFLNAYLELISAVLLAAVFRLYPGGLAAMGRSLLASVAGARDRARAAKVRLTELAELEADDADAPAGDGSTVDTPTGVADGKEPGPAVDGGAVRSWRPAAVVGAVKALAATPARLALAGVGRIARATRSRTRKLTAPAPLGLDGGDATAAEVTAEFADRADGAPTAAGDAVVHSNGHRTGDQAAEAVRAAVEDPDLPPRDQRAVLLEAEHVTVRFGGLTAVDDASLTVREGEIVGLIGPNGAGKTTLFNAIAGFNRPTEGRVRLYGHDVTDLPVSRRAQLGLARTFQLIQLFPQLTVFDNLLAATHLQNPTGFLQHMGISPGAMAAEAAARARVSRVVDLLDLDEVAGRQVAGLPFGVLRMVEVARALVTGARVTMLDEPASGLDERETDQLIEVLRFVRGLGATLLLIEHDVRMVTAVTDHLYVLERGKLIAEGVPSDVTADPAVIAAYLGQPADEVDAEVLV